MHPSGFQAQAVPPGSLSPCRAFFGPASEGRLPCTAVLWGTEAQGLAGRSPGSLSQTGAALSLMHPPLPLARRVRWLELLGPRRRLLVRAARWPRAVPRFQVRVVYPLAEVAGLNGRYSTCLCVRTAWRARASASGLPPRWISVAAGLLCPAEPSTCFTRHLWPLRELEAVASLTMWRRAAPLPRGHCPARLCCRAAPGPSTAAFLLRPPATDRDCTVLPGAKQG